MSIDRFYQVLPLERPTGVPMAKFLVFVRLGERERECGRESASARRERGKQRVPVPPVLFGRRKVRGTKENLHLWWLRAENLLPFFKVLYAPGPCSKPLGLDSHTGELLRLSENIFSKPGPTVVAKLSSFVMGQQMWTVCRSPQRAEDRQERRQTMAMTVAF